MKGKILGLTAVLLSNLVLGVGMFENFESDPPLQDWSGDTPPEIVSGGANGTSSCGRVTPLLDPETQMMEISTSTSRGSLIDPTRDSGGLSVWVRAEGNFTNETISFKLYLDGHAWNGNDSNMWLQVRLAPIAEQGDWVNIREFYRNGYGRSMDAPPDAEYFFGTNGALDDISQARVNGQWVDPSRAIQYFIDNLADADYLMLSSNQLPDDAVIYVDEIEFIPEGPVNNEYSWGEVKGIFK
jgi:hypothetical protein